MLFWSCGLRCGTGIAATPRNRPCSPGDKSGSQYFSRSCAQWRTSTGAKWTRSPGNRSCSFGSRSYHCIDRIGSGHGRNRLHWYRRGCLSPKTCEQQPLDVLCAQPTPHGATDQGGVARSIGKLRSIIRTAGTVFHHARQRFAHRHAAAARSSREWTLLPFDENGDERACAARQVSG